MCRSGTADRTTAKRACSSSKYKKKTYENYVDGVLDKEEYLSYKAEYEKQDKVIREKIQMAEQEKTALERQKNPMRTG